MRSSECGAAPELIPPHSIIGDRTQWKIAFELLLSDSMCLLSVSENSTFPPLTDFSQKAVQSSGTFAATTAPEKWIAERHLHTQKETVSYRRSSASWRENVSTFETAFERCERTVLGDRSEWYARWCAANRAVHE